MWPDQIKTRPNSMERSWPKYETKFMERNGPTLAQKLGQEQDKADLDQNIGPNSMEME